MLCVSGHSKLRGQHVLSASLRILSLLCAETCPLLIPFLKLGRWVAANIWS